MLANVFDITSCFRLSLPWGGRLISVIHIRSMEKISTHALRGEGDGISKEDVTYFGDFNPRPPWGGRRRAICQAIDLQSISIHALRGEGDNVW